MADSTDEDAAHFLRSRQVHYDTRGDEFDFSDAA